MRRGPITASAPQRNAPLSVGHIVESWENCGFGVHAVWNFPGPEARESQPEDTLLHANRGCSNGSIDTMFPSPF